MTELGDIYEKVKLIIKSKFNDMKESVSCIVRYDDNFVSLRKCLSDVCVKKDDMNKKVKEGEKGRQVISQQAATWLKDVQRLTENEELKELMYKDLETAKFVVRLTEKNVLKRSLIKDSEMQNAVVEVMKMLKDEIEKSDKEFKEMAEVDYKKVAQVMAEVIMHIFVEVKKVLKQDMEITVMVKKMLNDRDLDTLKRGDEEMEKIIMESRNISDDEYNLSLVGEVMNPLKEVARILITPTGNWLIDLGKLVDDAYFGKLLPYAKLVKEWLDVIDGLWIKKGLEKVTGDIIIPFECCRYHDRNQRSKAAQIMVGLIKCDILPNYQHDSVTRSLIFESKEKLLDQILDQLKDDQVNLVGVFGMGGIGKTVLAKEVNRKANDIFDVNVMVEVLDIPDIIHIQAAIAQTIDLPLHGVHSISQRADRLHDGLSLGGKKVLIILDNIWEELNLEEIGIPSICKLLLTTRERDLCREMGVRDMNILEVEVMEANEARDVLKSHIRDQVVISEYDVERLLSACGGLPLAIVSTANTLPNTDNYHEAYSILNKSYKFIKVDEKRIFFLLICLFPAGSSVSIESLARYGIGLNLFPCVDKLSKAMDVADTWAKELISSSMLIESHVESEVKIHAFMRSFAKSLAAVAEGRTFMEKGSPCSPGDHVFNEYTAFHLMFKNVQSGLTGIQTDKLQILKLRGPLTARFNDSLFERMVNLEVLDMSDINFRPCLPKSMRKLKELKTLCMEGCKLGNIKQIGDLVNLLVLSLRESILEELPSEIGELCKLQLLDLRGCRTKRVPLMSVDVMNRLSKLEVFYMHVLEIKIPKIEDLQIDALSIQYLDKFEVFVGDNRENERMKEFSRVLDLNGIDDIVGALVKSSLKGLLKEADWLSIRNSYKFENLVPQLDQEGFKDLDSLQVYGCFDVNCVVKGSRMNGTIAFPQLGSLDLNDLENLEIVCDGETPPGTFCRLQTLRLYKLEALQYVMPLAVLPPNLNKIEVSSCKSLEYLFIHNDEKHAPHPLFLKSLKLSRLAKITCLVGNKFFNISSAMQDGQFFFDGKIVFPFLELFQMSNCDSVVKLWREASGFQNLKDIKISHCGKLSSLGLCNIFSSLVKLETLSIVDCENIREVVSEQIVRFPQLKVLELSTLSNLQCFYGAGTNLEFPKLEKLRLNNLPCMKSFSKQGNSSALFHEKINFSCLEDLHMINLNQEVRGLWDRLTSFPASMLRHLKVSDTSLRQVLSLMFENLCSLGLYKFEDVEVLFSRREGSGWLYLQVPKLENLSVEYSDSVINLFPKEDYVHGAEEALALFCGKLKTLELGSLPKLNLIPLHLFKGLVSLTLFDLKWEYVISYDVLGDSLQLLEYLRISHCKKMEVVTMNVEGDVEFPRLKDLKLIHLDSVSSFSSYAETEATLCLPSLESLELGECPKMKHFWSGNIDAPALQKVSLEECRNMQHFMKGNPEHGVEFPSLQSVDISYCPKIKSFSDFSTSRLLTPNLSDIQYQYTEYSMQEYDNLNDFLIERYMCNSRSPFW